MTPPDASSTKTAAPPPPRARRRWVPHPVLSCLLVVVWLLLQQSVAVPQVLTAVVLGLAVPWAVQGFIGAGARPRRLALIVRFAALVLWDIVVSNVVVARLALSPRATPRPAWLRVPLELNDPTAITLLASVITMTPGTVSCVVDEDRREIVVHALDCADPQAAVAQMKQRYEQPLKEILG